MRTGEGLVAARNVHINMVRDVSSRGRNVNVLEFKWQQEKHTLQEDMLIMLALKLKSSCAHEVVRFEPRPDFTVK